MPKTDRSRVRLALQVALGFALAPLQGADATGWSVNLRTEPSTVEIGSRTTTWWTQQVLAEYREVGKGGYFLAAETQQRGDETNPLLSAGFHRRWTEWTLAFQAATGVDPVFVPKASFEGQVGRRIAERTYLSAGFASLQFPAARVQLWSLAVARYYPRGEVELRLRQGRNETFNHDISVLLLRVLFDDGGTLAYGGTVATGRNLFDALAVPVDGGRGWTSNLYLKLRLNEHHGFRFDLGMGQEAPSFRQKLAGVTYRRTF